jgi:hypothetical protein
MYWLTEDMVVEFLPLGIEGRMSNRCGCEMPGVNGWTTFIFKNPFGLHTLLDYLSGFEEFMQNSLGGIWPQPS